jgi:uncharacterized RDD family membrane protein YckC
MSQPSGWYDDPQNDANLRYWDGVLWTDHTTPKRSPTAPQSTIGRPIAFPEQAPQPGYSGYSGHQDSPGTPGATGGPTQAPPGQTPYLNPGQLPYAQPPTAYGYSGAPQGAWHSFGPTTPDGRPLAEWWQRLLARVIDGLIVGALSVAVGFPYFRGILTWYIDLFRQAMDDAAAGRTTTLDSTALSSQLTGYLVSMTLVSLAVSVVYETVFLVRWGATPGKMALGTSVRRVGTPGPLSVGAALRRLAIHVGTGLVGLLPIISLLGSAASLLDALWLLWDPRRQCLHDKLADTVVVQKPKNIGR